VTRLDSRVTFMAGTGVGLRSELRRSLRLQGDDYTIDGAYFVTIVTQDRALLFGNVDDCEVRYSDAGLVIDSWWRSIEPRFPTVLTDEYVVMPNHLHGVLFIGGQTENDRPWKGGHTGPPLQRNVPGNPSLSKIMQWFKTMTTNVYIRGVKEDGWPPFRKRLWQRDYHDHVVRNERALNDIRAYIINNPVR
jgi:REP-associated tyrosine transposase